MVILVIARMVVVPRAPIVSLPVDGVVVVADTAKARIQRLSGVPTALRRAWAKTLGLAHNRVKCQNDRDGCFRVDPSSSVTLESLRVPPSPNDKRSDALSGASQVGVDSRSRQDRS